MSLISWFGSRSPSRKKDRGGSSVLGSGDYPVYLLNNSYNSAKSKQTITPETAKGISAYMACIRVISEDIAKLPIDIYKPVGNVKQPANEEVEWLLNYQPNPYTTAIAFRETITSHALGWGLGIAEIQRDGFGYPIAMWIIHPSRVSYERNNNGSITWKVMNDDNTQVTLKDRNIFKVNGMGDDGIAGQTPAQVGAESLGVALAQQDYSSGFYANGGTMSGILKIAGKLDATASERIRSSWAKMYGGGENSGKVVVLEQGSDFSPVSILPADAQFIETRQFTVEDICRWFRVAPHKVQHLLRSTNNNIEAQNIDHATDTLHPWAVRWEQQIVIKLLEEGERARISFAELLRGDNASRATYLREMFNSGAFSPDDIRVYEGWNPRDDGRGGEYFTPVNMMTPKERDKAKAQSQPGETVNREVATAKILEPFAKKEANALVKHLEGKPIHENFFNRNITQIQKALSGIVSPEIIIDGREKYLQGYRLDPSGYSQDSAVSGLELSDIILAELIDCFKEVSDD